MSKGVFGWLQKFAKCKKNLHFAIYSCLVPLQKKDGFYGEFSVLQPVCCPGCKTFSRSIPGFWKKPATHVFTFSSAFPSPNRHCSTTRTLKRFVFSISPLLPLSITRLQTNSVHLWPVRLRRSAIHSQKRSTRHFLFPYSQSSPSALLQRDPLFWVFFSTL